jgi:O-antigen/teichoic acid export membrane protein
MPTWTAHWLRDARLLLLSQFIVVLSTTALAIVLARSLGPSGWGLFSALLGLSLALSTFVDLGLGTWLLRELSKLMEEEHVLERRQEESSRRIIGAVIANTSFGLLLLLGSIVVALSIGAKENTIFTLLCLVIYTSLLTASNCLEAFLRSQRRLKRVVAAILLEKLLLLALATAAALLFSALWAIAVAYLVAGLARLSFVGYTIFARHLLPVVRPTLRHVQRFVMGGIPFAFNTVALNVIPRLDTLLVAGFSATAAGYFALGDRAVGPALIVPVVTSAALYPFLSREASSSRAGWKISGGMLVVGSAIALAGVVLAPVAVPAIFGQKYSSAVPVVRLMVLVVPFVYASNPLLAQLYTSGKERQVFAATLVASLLGTGAVVAGQVSEGPTGAAVGYVLRQALFTVALGFVALRGFRTAEASRVE